MCWGRRWEVQLPSALAASRMETPTSAGALMAFTEHSAPAPLQPGSRLCPLNSSPQPLQPGDPAAQAQTHQPPVPGLLLAAWAAGSAPAGEVQASRERPSLTPGAGQAQMTMVSLPAGCSQEVRGREPVQGLGNTPGAREQR